MKKDDPHMESSLKLGVIGAGHWGPNLIRNFHLNKRSRVAWVCDADPVRLQTVAQRYTGIEAISNWEQALSRPDCEAVVVCTPTFSHFSIAKRALLSGKHVFVEKPLCFTHAEAQELLRVAKAQERKLMVGHVFLFNPAIRKIRELLVRGDIGDVYYIYSTRTNLGPIRGDVNALWDLGSHDISIFLYLLGQSPLSVAGHGASFINPPLEDVVSASLRFADGVFATMHVSWLNPRKVRELVVVGSRKMLVFDDMNAADSLRVYDKNVSPELSRHVVNDTIGLFRKSIIEGEASTIPLLTEEPLKNECEAFLDWVLCGQEPPTTGVFGAEVVRILEWVSTTMKVQTAPSELKIKEASEYPAHPNL